MMARNMPATGIKIMKNTVTTFFAVVASLLICMPSMAASNDAAADYQKLLAEESELAGQVAFDLHFAEAALAANEAGAAVFALQRVLAQEPDNAEAHMGIARAYFDLGEDSSARRHFGLLYTVADADTQAYIQNYLTALDQRSGARKPRTTAYAGLDIGYDDNITQIRDGQPPGTLGIFAIQSSKFSNLYFGARHQQPIDATWYWQVGADGDYEKYHDFDDVDKRRLRLDGSVGGRMDLWSWNFGLSAGEIRRDNQELFTSYDLSAVAEHRAEGFWKKLGLRLLDRDYSSQFVGRDVDGYELLLGARHAGSNVRWSDVGIDLLLGDESAKNDPADTFGRDYVTARLRWYLMPTVTTRLVVGYDYSKSEFNDNGGQTFVPGVSREEDFRSALVRLSVPNVWRKGLDLNVQFSRDENNSNIPTLTYDRNRISVGLRYNWGV